MRPTLSEQRHDIESAEDIHLLVESFYAQIRKDSMLGPLFNITAAINWDHHLQLYSRIQYQQEHMDRWLTLFDMTIEELFCGVTANKAKHWARGIARNLENQIARQNTFKGDD